MSHKLVVGVAALGLFTLLAAFALPPAIDASQSTENRTMVLDDGETATVTEGLNVTANDTANDQAVIDFEDTETGLTQSVTVNEGNTTNITLNDENVTVTVVETTSTDVTLDVEYSPRYGWDGGAKTVVAQLDVILVMFAFVLLLGAMGAVVS